MRPAASRLARATSRTRSASARPSTISARSAWRTIAAHEQGLIAYATKLLSDVPGLRIIGTASEKAGVISFVLHGKESEGVGAALNREGIAVRAGHHCAQPILRRFGLESTVRPSFALYNTYADIDALVAALRRIQSGHNPLRGDCASRRTIWRAGEARIATSELRLSGGVVALASRTSPSSSASKDQLREAVVRRERRQRLLRIGVQLNGRERQASGQ